MGTILTSINGGLLIVWWDPFLLALFVRMGSILTSIILFVRMGSILTSIIRRLMGGWDPFLLALSVGSC